MAMKILKLNTPTENDQDDGTKIERTKVYNDSCLEASHALINNFIT